jgi:hypothetical protein
MNTSKMISRQARTLLGLLASLMFFLFAASAHAQSAIVSFDPAQSSIVCGEAGTIEVYIDDSIDDLRGFSMILAFDPELITPVTVEAGSLVTGAGCPHSLFWVNPDGTGTIEVDGAMLGCSIQGPGAILSIVFEAAEGVEGDTALTCQSLSLRDSQNVDIPAECSAATIEVTCAVNTHQAVWGTVKSLFR